MGTEVLMCDHFKMASSSAAIASSSLKYTLIDKDESDVTSAVATLRESDKLAVDCEGMELSRDGKLTLLTISTKEKAYVFDIMKLGKEAFELGLKSLLENKEQTKLMFDCRRDSDAMYHQFGVKLSGVLDLQIMEILYRETIGEFDIGRKEERLARYGREEPPIYVHGLKKCLQNYVHNNSYLLAKSRVSISTIKTGWVERPLPDTLLAYASVDVLSLFPLFDFFNAKLSGNFMTRLTTASEAYLDFFREKPDYGGLSDIYKQNAFFPMHVLPRKGSASITPLRSGGTKCSGCERMLPTLFFTCSEGRRGSQFCPVCQIALWKSNRRR